MKSRVIFLLIMMVTAACLQPAAPTANKPLELASFTENYVQVSITLTGNSESGHILSATFTPPVCYHLYSKDIPLTGVEGLGRPTLLELTEDSQMRALGELIESVEAETPDFEPQALLVYPTGAVTLSLPVSLPAGESTIEDTVQVTYMACSDEGCKAPVIGKVVVIHIPGDRFHWEHL